MGKVVESKRAMILTLAGLAIVVIGCAAALFFMVSGGSAEASAEDDAAEAGNAAVSQAMEIDTSADHAKELYGLRVEDTNDTASIVKLLEFMGLENVCGKYAATVSAGDGTQVLTVSVEEPVKKADKKTLDDNMTLCAQQIMALMPSVGEVQWTYALKSSGAEDEAVTVSLDEAGADEQLSGSVKDCGKSAKAVRKLLAQQAGETI